MTQETVSLESLVEIRLDEFTTLELHPITYYQEDEETTNVGRPDISRYLSLGMDAVTILKELENGQSFAAILQTFQEQGLTLEDLIEFAKELIDSEFVYKVNGQEVTPVADLSRVTKTGGNWFTKMMFNKYMWVIYAIALVGNFVLINVFPKLTPRGSDVFVSDNGFISLLFIIFGMWLVVFVHEYAHVFCAKNEGVASKIQWGYRWVFLVIQTEVPDVYMIPRRRRTGIYLAGPAWTSTAIFLLLLVQFFPLSDLTLKICKFFVIMQFQSYVFQTLLFLRTDLYFTLSNLFRMDTLNEMANQVFKSLFTFKFAALRQFFVELPKLERNILRLYSLYYAIGVVITLYMFSTVDVPILHAYLEKTSYALVDTPLFSKAYWDGVALGTLGLNPIVILSTYIVLDLIKKFKVKKQVRIMA